MFKPTFTITPNIAKSLSQVEVGKAVVAQLPLSFEVIASLRESSRLETTHFSTQIEGNRLTAEQVSASINSKKAIPDRERDQREVKHHYLALEFLDALTLKYREQNPVLIQEKDIQTMHGLVMFGKKKPTPYRDGQNVIKDSGGIVYMPPEAADVPLLMADLVAWLCAEIDADSLPIPLIAGVAHYQFATIHPYYDGNGRTARLLTNLVLHSCGYDLKGIYNLSEYYAKDLRGYYNALDIGNSHNYYMGRENADITPWLEYFCRGMAQSFERVRRNAERFAAPDTTMEQQLYMLTDRQKAVLSLFKSQRFLTTREIAAELGVHVRTALTYCHKWCDEGFMVQHGEAPKSRKYELASDWRAILTKN